MMRLSFPAAILGVLIVTTAAQAAQNDGPVQCEVLETASGGLVELTGQAWSSSAISGRYEFTLTKTGTGGSSSVAQSGDFQAKPGQKVQVGYAQTDHGQGTRYQVDLKLTWPGGELQCTADGSTITAANGTKSKGTSSGNFASSVQKGGNNSSVVIQSN